jgi:membrane protein implicated in regulation of membrane protease activity
MMPDPRWLDALKLPQKVIAGLLLFCLLLLVFNFFSIVSLAAISALALPIVIILTLLFGSLSLAAIGAVIYDVFMQRHKKTLLARRREIRREEAQQELAQRQATALARLDYLSKEEIRYVANCLRKNEQSFLAWFHSPHVSNLMAKELVSTPGGTHNQDYYPFFFCDFAWATLLQRKDEFIAKDDEHKRLEAAAEKERARRR